MFNFFKSDLQRKYDDLRADYNQLKDEAQSLAKESAELKAFKLATQKTIIHEIYGIIEERAKYINNVNMNKPVQRKHLRLVSSN